jgi:chaperonin GroES
MFMANNPQITPVGDRVLVREITEESEEETTDAGIIIPETVSEDDHSTTRGEVEAIGEGELDEDGERKPIPVSEGDTVLFSWGDQITMNGEDYHVVDSGNILATIS